MHAVRINVTLLLTDITCPFLDMDLVCFKTCCLSLRPGWGEEGYFEKNWVTGCGPLPTTLILFMPKTCDFQYPIYDLIINQYLVSGLPYTKFLSSNIDLRDIVKSFC